MLQRFCRLGPFQVWSAISRRAWLARHRARMSSMAALGPSYRPLYRFLALEPDTDQLSLREAYAAFCIGGDGFYRDWWEFARDVRRGHVVPFIIEHGNRETQFGIELMSHPETGGPVFSVLYYTGELSGDLISELAFFLYDAMQHHKLSLHGHNKPGYLRVVGRKGWARLIRRIGVEIDDDGYIADDQDAVRYGMLKHLN
jgi:hypothetical protein